MALDSYGIAIFEIRSAGRSEYVARRNMTTGCRTLLDRFSGKGDVQCKPELHHRVEIAEEVRVDNTGV